MKTKNNAKMRDYFSNNLSSHNEVLITTLPQKQLLYITPQQVETNRQELTTTNNNHNYQA